MKERPILMSAPMVRAILEDRKTETRRVVAIPRSTGAFVCADYGGGWWPYVSYDGESLHADTDGNEKPMGCPYGQPGDRLWVREAWRGAWHVVESTNFHLMYTADGSESMKYVDEEYVLPKAAAKPENIMTPLFMPRWASRITLEITDVKVQKLHDISEEDATAEGIELLNGRYTYNGGLHESRTAVESYRALWDSINGKKLPWDSNPWVWVVSFERVMP